MDAKQTELLLELAKADNEKIALIAIVAAILLLITVVGLIFFMTRLLVPVFQELTKAVKTISTREEQQTAAMQRQTLTLKRLSGRVNEQSTLIKQVDERLLQVPEQTRKLIVPMLLDFLDQAAHDSPSGGLVHNFMRSLYGNS